MANYKYKKIKIRHANTGKMLNVYYTGNVSDGTNVSLWTDDGSLEQQWYFDGSKLQTMRDRSKVLDRHRGTNNADVWTDEAVEDAILLGNRLT